MCMGTVVPSLQRERQRVSRLSAAAEEAAEASGSRRLQISLGRRADHQSQSLKAQLGHIQRIVPGSNIMADQAEMGWRVM